MKWFILLPVLLACFSCNKQELLVKNSEVMALGSGGMGITNLYPMNSYESILQCLYLGADGTEIDIQMTRDSILVAYHDEELSASTGMEGSINNYSWEELEEASYNAAPYTDYGLVRLDTLFSKLGNPDDYIFSFDCKLFNSSDDYNLFIKKYVAAIIALLEAYQMEGNVLIESRDRAFLEYFKGQRAQYQFYINHPSFEEALVAAEELGLAGIIMDAEEISAEEIAEAHEKGLYVQVWGTDNKGQNIEAINKKPDYIQANDIQSLVDLVN